MGRGIFLYVSSLHFIQDERWGLKTTAESHGVARKGIVAGKVNTETITQMIDEMNEYVTTNTRSEKNVSDVLYKDIEFECFMEQRVVLKLYLGVISIIDCG